MPREPPLALRTCSRVAEIFSIRGTVRPAMSSDIASRRGNDVLVGAYAANGGVGGAYLFDGATYQSKLTIVNPTPNSNELFGNCVAAMGNNILVAAQWNNPGSAAMRGAVYLYDGTSGTLMHTFQPPVIGPAPVLRHVRQRGGEQRSPHRRGMRQQKRLRQRRRLSLRL